MMAVLYVTVALGLSVIRLKHGSYLVSVQNEGVVDTFSGATLHCSCGDGMD